MIAVEAALTGHLVLSTLHTNDAASTPLRLVEMGVEPFLVTSALDCVVAQRLARAPVRQVQGPVPAERSRADRKSDWPTEDLDGVEWPTLLPPRRVHRVRAHRLQGPLRVARGDARDRGDRAPDHRAALDRGHPEDRRDAGHADPARRRPPQGRHGLNLPRGDLPSGELRSRSLVGLRLGRIMPGVPSGRAAGRDARSGLADVALLFAPLTRRSPLRSSAPAPMWAHPRAPLQPGASAADIPRSVKPAHGGSASCSSIRCAASERRSSTVTCSRVTASSTRWRKPSGPNQPLPAVLLRLGLVGSKDLTAALADQIGMPFVDFLETPIHQEAPTLLTAELARKWLALPVDFEDRKLVVAFAEPADDEAVAAVGRRDDLRDHRGGRRPGRAAQRDRHDLRRRAPSPRSRPSGRRRRPAR